MARAIGECPVCHSKDLEQEFATHTDHLPIRIGGEHTNRTPILDGCYCNNCGTKSKFNKAGECPACRGSGEFEYKTSSCGITRYSRKEQCPTCEGSGRIQ